MGALEIQGISRSFGGTAALTDVTLSVAKGEIICLVGQSGCGKSSLLRIIAGIDIPDHGLILLNGRQASGPDAFVEPENRNIGFVFQDYALFPHLTVEQNVLFGLKGMAKADASRRAAEVIAQVGIPQLSKRYPHMLSGGEQQRVALARALAPKPAILLMDEPFSNLDRGLRERVRNETLSLLRQTQTTVIMVTHDPEEALSAGDRVVLMKDGRVVQQGSGYDIHDRPLTSYAAEFFCAFNKVPGRFSAGHVETPLGRLPHALDVADGTQALVYLRPQGIAVRAEGATFSGRVRHRVLMGEIEQISIDVDGLDEPLRIRTMQRLPAGANVVGLSILPESYLLFADPEPGSITVT
ncbi:MAG TPA: ABC transporter ATP-binding protein [Pararhizobium sp.]|uniref:ABC transporter ATP-binding protein n=1 Tax=Pararhizobium sp. TaxID=1977563 RepID=UPI002C9DFB6A|nr:ABC transporter ATP-binding protein [Pararhizobium sp.]HTO30546.1 ABC transporter ATP-binding protein [Pararhizobium sp.]